MKVVDLQLEPQLPIRQVQIQYNREAAANYGLTMAQISSVVETALNGRVVSQVPEDQQLIDITVSLPESARNSLDAISAIPISTPTGELISLGTVTNVGYGMGANVVNREDVFRPIAAPFSLAIATSRIILDSFWALHPSKICSTPSSQSGKIYGFLRNCTASPVRAAQANADLVVVSMHGGAEGTGAMHTRDRPEIFFGEDRGNLVQFSRRMIEAGADLVLGHGPHVPRALELYQDRLIAYSLGNFVGYRTLSTQAQLAYSLVLEVELEATGTFVQGKIHPVRLNNSGIPAPAPSGESIELMRNLTQADFPNTPLNIAPDGVITPEFAPASNGQER